jgi:hypothetical protein
MLAHGVELADGRAGGQEKPRELLLLGERDRRRRRRRQRGAAAGDEEQNQVVLTRASRHFEEPGRGRQPARVGHRMARFGDVDAPQGRRAAVLDDDEAVRDPITDDLFGRGRHRAAGLAGAEEKDARMAALEAKVGSDERRHVARRQRRVPDGA